MQAATLNEIPENIVNHIRACVELSSAVRPQVEPRTFYKYHKAIHSFLKIAPFSTKARSVAEDAITSAAQVMDNPADLINVGIEFLIKERFELPGYSTLNELVVSIRTSVNSGFFSLVSSRLTQAEQSQLDGLLESNLLNGRTPYNNLKQLPKRPTLSHLQDLLVHLMWLSTLPDADRLLQDIPHAKLTHFASETKALDAAELQDVSLPKRYTLLLALIRQARRQTRDDIVEMFLKRMATIHKHAREKLERIQLEQRQTTENLVTVFADVLRTLEDIPNDAEAGAQIKEMLAPAGGAQKLLDDCEQVIVIFYGGNNYLPLVWKYFRSHRSVLMQLLRILKLGSTTSDQSLIHAITYLKENDKRRADTIVPQVDLDFAPELWQRIVRIRRDKTEVFSRRHFEACVFSCLAAELKSGDVYVEGSEAYADYRAQLLSWKECEPLVSDYCAQLGFASSAREFVASLRQQLSETAQRVDRDSPDNSSLTIDPKGEPVLRRAKAPPPTPSSQVLAALINERLSERNLLDVLNNVEHWLGFTRHFGPLSGSDPKLDKPQQKYLLTSFCYGTNLGPYQSARHLQGAISAHTHSYINRRHITSSKLDAALTDIINRYNQLSLPRVWGTGSVAAADGTQINLAEDNPFAEYHIRYGSYGGIAYHHVSDMYIALFSHFIPCGVWEAIYILEGLLKNKSDIQPDTIHADTQGQSAPVFALAYLLGIKLMPRIRNWSDLKLFRPDKETCYQHIDSLFNDAVDWNLIQTHWQDLLQVVLSIKVGKISSPVLLRKLSNYSRKSRLYRAFRELGRVRRTSFLLTYISDLPLREQITAATNIVEAYHGYSQWFSFGGDVIASNDREEQEKAVKYNDLLANAVIYHNAVDLTRILQALMAEGHPVRREDVATLSPYLTRHIKRFGDYLLDTVPLPTPTVEELILVL